MSTKISGRTLVLNCIREYYNNGLIDEDDRMVKKLLRQFHRTNKKMPVFIYVLSDMVRRNIVYGPRDIDDLTIIVFKPGKLDLILDNKDDYVLKGENKFVVSQNVGFREKKPRATDSPDCTICNKTFGSVEAANQHKRAKGHVLTKLLKLAPYSEKYVQQGDIIAEYERGKGNAPETINNENRAFSISLTITNNTDMVVLLDGIQMVNAIFSDRITIEFVPDTPIAATGSLVVNLRLNFADAARSYNLPLMITYKNVDAEVKGFTKHLTYEIIPDQFADLQPTTPYHRLNPVASDMDETIVPGEKPDFNSNFVTFIKLQQYKLTNEYIQIFNSGLKSEKVDKRANELQRKVKRLLDVPEPSNCLTVQNYSDMLNVLLFLEEHQMKIDIRNYDTQTNGLAHLRGNRYKLPVPDLAENRPSLIVGDSVYVKNPGDPIKYEGIVHEKLLDSVILGFNTKFSKLFVPNKKFSVSFSYNRTTLKVEHQAVALVARFSKYFFPTIGDLPTLDLGTFTFNWYNKERLQSNVQQQQAVEHIVKGTSGSVPYLIFGPPGTGKTMTVVEAILQVLRHHPGKRILVCTPSNNAANEVNRRLVTFGSFSKIDMLRYVSYSYPISEIPEEVKKFCNIEHGSITHPTLESLLKFKIVITTLTTAGRLYNAGVPNDHFSYVFIDESGHATESQTLIPITSVLINKACISGQVILAGDPQQLGPIIHSSEAKKYGFGTSMLERLMNTNDMYKRHEGGYNNNVLMKLLKNYRSHPEIIALSNKAFYANELEAVGNPLSHIALGHEVLPNGKFPMIFHSILGADQRESNSPSFFNVQEIAQVCTYVNQLVGSRMQGLLIADKHIAIITPYRKQVQKLRQQFKKMNYPKIMIGSVEQLQGQERLIVIITTVRSKPEFVQHDYKFHLGFLKNPKRFNVAITRAIALLIVVGNPNLLKYDPHWGQYIERCQQNRAVAGAPFSMELNDEEAQLIAGFENIQIEDDIVFGRGNQ